MAAPVPGPTPVMMASGFMRVSPRLNDIYHTK
jgi:hypothetical protein